MLDYLVIGQGIAGSAICWELLQRNSNFIVYDQGHEHSASLCAGGLMNPITGRRFVKTWMGEQVFPFAAEAYRKQEAILNTPFFHSIDIIRLLHSVKEENDILAKDTYSEEDQEYRIDNDFHNPQLQPFHAAIKVNGGFHLDIAKYLNAYRGLLMRSDRMVQRALDWQKLEISASSVRYEDFEARQIICCEGAGMRHNPHFNLVPIVPTKGEYLVIRSTKLKLEEVLNSNGMILPMGLDLYYVGSTHEWNVTQKHISEKGKSKLLEKVHRLISCDFEIVDHQAGIRPATKDRRPLLGQHPEHRSLWLFNGMGTKGVSLAPFFAHHLMEHIENGNALMPEVNLKRYLD